MTGNDSIQKEKKLSGTSAPQPGQTRIPNPLQEKPILPPISPCAAMNSSIIISNLFSSNPAKTKLADEYKKYLEADTIERYKAYTYSSRYISDIYPLVLAQAFYMKENRQNNNRRLDEEDTMWKSKKASLDDLKKSEMQKLEDTYGMELKDFTERKSSRLKALGELSTPISLKGSVSRLIGVGGIATLLYAAQREIMNVISAYAPNTFHLVYLTFFVSVGGAVLLTNRIIGSYISKKTAETKESFNEEEIEIKKGYNDEKQELIKKQEEREETEFKRYAERKKKLEDDDFKYRQDRAAFVYLETFKVCESFYPNYIKKYSKYTELKEKSPEKALNYVRDHASRLARAKLLLEHTKGDIAFTETAEKKE
jgi:hypothetical protein